MGCNTSKDSAPQDEKGADKENPAGENRKEENGENKINENDTKSSSARTITLRSNGTAKTIEDKSRQSANSETEASDQQVPNEAQAATKIQAAFRGHKTRQSMKQPAKNEEKEPSRQELENEFPLNDEELCHAATKIQASFRGHMTRKQAEGTNKPKDDSGSKGDSSKPGEEELDIDLTDPELNKAAQKIQASFRGHMHHRKEGGQATDSK